MAFGSIHNHVIWRNNIAIYDEVDADVYMVPGNHERAAEIAYYCKKRGKKYVFLAGSDIDYSLKYRANPNQPDLYGVPGHLLVYAIENASLHIVQQENQAQLLRNGYGRSCVVIRNPIDLTPRFQRNQNAADILWVGSSDDWVRRPSFVLELARQLPEFHFVVLMVPAVLETHDRCTQLAKSLPNVTLVGRTPYQEVERFFANAKLLVNTSSFEGFPNTFLQAAKYGVPIVAVAVDPGGMLSSHGCGFTCGDDLDRTREYVRLLMTSPGLYAEKSRNCLEYVRTRHDKDKIVAEHERVLLDLLH